MTDEDLDSVDRRKASLNSSLVYGYSLLGYDKVKKEVKLRNPWGWLKDVSKYKGVVKNIEKVFLNKNIYLLIGR